MSTATKRVVLFLCFSWLGDCGLGYWGSLLAGSTLSSKGRLDYKRGGAKSEKHHGFVSFRLLEGNHGISALEGAGHQRWRSLLGFSADAPALALVIGLRVPFAEAIVDPALTSSRPSHVATPLRFCIDLNCRPHQTQDTINAIVTHGFSCLAFKVTCKRWRGPAQRHAS